MNIDVAIDMKKREEWIDAVRALAICLVVFGHQYAGNNTFFVFTSPIKMPLFFVLSGYLFNPKGFKTIPFLKNIFFRLIIPWLAFGLFFSFVKIPFQGIEFFIQKIQRLVSGKDLWFMPAFIIGQSIFYFIMKYIKREPYVALACVLVGIFGLYSSYIHILRYAMLDVALTSQIFFMMGHLLKHYKKLLSLSSRWIVFLVCVYVLTCCVSLVFWPGKCLDVHVGRYYNYFVCFLLIVIGSLVIMNVFRKVSRYPRFVSLVGQHTLVIYMLHSYVAAMVSKAFGIMKMPTNGHFVFAVSATVISVVVCTYTSMIISRYVPLLNGTKKKR